MFASAPDGRVSAMPILDGAVGEWCNGSTRRSGRRSWGSNPCSPVPRGEDEDAALRRRLLGPVPVELPVPPAGVDELVVGPGLDDLAVLEHDDPARVADGRQPVGDDDGRTAGEEPAEAVLDLALRADVDVRRRLV